MALIPTINLCLRTGCSELIFKETTGVYHATTNTGGYGAPNPVVGDFDTAVLTVIAPDLTEYTIDLFAEGFPTSDDQEEYTIDLADLGNRTVIEDGYWQFVYNLHDNNTDTDYSATFAGIFLCNTKCCVEQLLLLIDENKFGIPDKRNEKRINEYLMAKAYLDSLTYYANCGNLDKFDNIKRVIDKLCANVNCTTCN